MYMYVYVYVCVYVCICVYVYVCVCDMCIPKGVGGALRSSDKYTMSLLIN